MELTFETFDRSMKFLESCFLEFKIEPGADMYWYKILKEKFMDDGLFPVIFKYCQSMTTLRCPEDIIDFVNLLLIDAAPSAEQVIDAIISSVNLAKRLENKPDAVVPESLKNKMKARYRDELIKTVVSQVISFEVLTQSGILTRT